MLYATKLLVYGLLNTYVEKSCSFGLFVLAVRAGRSLVSSIPVCIVSSIWNLIVSVPDHCPFKLLYMFHV